MGPVFHPKQSELIQAGGEANYPFSSRVTGIVLRRHVGVTLRSAGPPWTIRVNHAVSGSRHGKEWFQPANLQVSTHDSYTLVPEDTFTVTDGQQGYVRVCQATTRVCLQTPRYGLMQTADCMSSSSRTFMTVQEAMRRKQKPLHYCSGDKCCALSQADR